MTKIYDNKLNKHDSHPLFDKFYYLYDKTMQELNDLMVYFDENSSEGDNKIRFWIIEDAMCKAYQDFRRIVDLAACPEVPGSHLQTLIDENCGRKNETTT